MSFWYVSESGALRLTDTQSTNLSSGSTFLPCTRLASPSVSTRILHPRLFRYMPTSFKRSRRNKGSPKPQNTISSYLCSGSGPMAAITALKSGSSLRRR